MPCTKGTTGCHRLCAHRTLVDDYRVARMNAEQARDDVTHGWATELREHPPIVTFKDWLKQMASRRAAQPAEEHAA